MERVTEYCQWEQHYTESKDDEGDTLRTYYYVKLWRTRPIISVLFDQPFHHHNPQRDPAPSLTKVTPHVGVNDFVIDTKLVSKMDGPWECEMNLFESSLISGIFITMLIRSKTFGPVMPRAFITSSLLVDF